MKAHDMLCSVLVAHFQGNNKRKRRKKLLPVHPETGWRRKQKKTRKASANCKTFCVTCKQIGSRKIFDYILSNHWRIFKVHFHLSRKKVNIITLAAIIFQDVVIGASSYRKVYVPSMLADSQVTQTVQIIKDIQRSNTPIEIRHPVSVTKAVNTCKEAKSIQQEFKEHFINDGCFPWQWRCASGEWFIKIYVRY